ncbi:hypothetical protein GCM10023189_50460 [Nibrella saemangeumensis]|uniref:DUF6970 domain-containing protein n=1 Tax=Nibrella saemangeumensis TaxID=1084526 RepID=A0ABP8NJ17_9BACT
MKKHLLCFSLVLACFLALSLQAFSQLILIPACNATQPLKELPWLKMIVDDTTGINGFNIIVYEATYKNQTIYRVENNIAHDFATVTLYTCLGSVLCQSQTTIAGLQSTCSDLFNEVTIGALLYRRFSRRVSFAK